MKAKMCGLHDGLCILRSPWHRPDVLVELVRYVPEIVGSRDTGMPMNDSEKAGAEITRSRVAVDNR